MMKEYVKEEVAAALRESVATVVFEKNDGTERTMVCTLNPMFLPTPDAEKTSRKVSDEVVAAWDIEKNDWRSFRLDSIVSIKYEPLEE